MSIFEIELNNDFKILNSIVFLDATTFAKYYKLNNLCDNKFDNSEFLKYILSDAIVKVGNDDFVGKRGLFGEPKDSFESIADVIKTDISTTPSSEEVVELYYEWQLFYIAIEKMDDLPMFKSDFCMHLESFRFIAEIRYKKYVIRNLENFLSFDKTSSIIEVKTSLAETLKGYIKSHVLSPNGLIEFLKFLVNFRRALLDKEKYKLMWNIEVYIIEALYCLMDKNYPLEEAYSLIGGGTYSELHKSIIYKSLYIKESKRHFENFVPLLEELFCNKEARKIFFESVLPNCKYEDVLFTYIEVNKIFNADKRSDIVLGAMIKAIVLGVEALIRDRIGCNNKGLFECIKELKSGSHEFKRLRDLIDEKEHNEQFFIKLGKLIDEEKKSKEKYLMIYYHARNNLAHNNIDLDKFFGEQNIIKHVIDAVMVVLYALENYEVSGTLK